MSVLAVRLHSTHPRGGAPASQQEKQGNSAKVKDKRGKTKKQREHKYAVPSNAVLCWLTDVNKKIMAVLFKIKNVRFPQ